MKQLVDLESHFDCCWISNYSKFIFYQNYTNLLAVQPQVGTGALTTTGSWKGTLCSPIDAKGDPLQRTLYKDTMRLLWQCFSLMKRPQS